MKKVSLLILIICLSLLLHSCGLIPLGKSQSESAGSFDESQTESTNQSVPMNDKSEDASAPEILSLEERYNSYTESEKLFFVYCEKVYCRENGVDTVLWEKPSELSEASVFELYVWENNLYFLTCNVVDSFQLQVWKLDLFERTAHTFQAEEWKENSFHEAQYCDDILYLEIGFSLYSFNLTTGEIESLISDVGIFEYSKDKLYYIDKIEKTFTIYQYDLKTGQQEILLGDGIHNQDADPGTQYRDVEFVDDALFYYQWFPGGIYLFKADKAILVSSDEGIWANTMFEFDHCLYFVQGDTQSTSLMKYDSKTQRLEKVCALEDCDYFYSSVRNGIVHYDGESETHYLSLET